MIYYKECKLKDGRVLVIRNGEKIPYSSLVKEVEVKD